MSFLLLLLADLLHCCNSEDKSEISSHRVSFLAGCGHGVVCSLGYVPVCLCGTLVCCG